MAETVEIPVEDVATLWKLLRICRIDDMTAGEIAIEQEEKLRRLLGIDCPEHED